MTELRSESEPRQTAMEIDSEQSNDNATTLVRPRLNLMDLPAEIRVRYLETRYAHRGGDDLLRLYPCFAFGTLTTM